MDRPGFTIETVAGVSYDANHIHYAKVPFSQIPHGYIIGFICSGEEICFDPTHIKEIRFSPKGNFFCNECDKRILRE